jgi:thiol-disulfide isomerase/thioredoxin
MSKAKTFLTICFCFGILSACTKPQVEQGYKDTNGNTIKLSQYQGKWVFINYWAPWCIPCRDEIEQLNAFYIAHHDKDAVVLGVNYDHLPPEQLPALVTRFRISYPVLISDPAKQLGIKDISALPVTFVLAPEGKLVKTLWGAQTKASLEKAISN